MMPTRRRVLVALAAVAAAVVWAGLRIADSESSTVPAMPWTVPVALAAVAIGIAASAVTLRARLRGDVGARPVDPIAAARMAVLAKASSHAGALLVGIYAGLGLFLLGGDESPLRRDRALLAGLAAVASLALLGAGLFLEKVCRVQPPDEPSAPA
jgi:hypothetical protein